MTEDIAKRVLVVDDSPAIRRVVKSVLELKGYDTLEANDGKDAMDVLAQRNVQLIISDIEMPRMNGYDFLKVVRQDPKINNIPVVFLTTEARPENDESAGNEAQGWLQKPFKATALLSTVEQLID